MELSWGPREKLLLTELVSKVGSLDWPEISKQTTALLDQSIDLNTTEEVCQIVYSSICTACAKECVLENFDVMKVRDIATFQRGELTTELVRLIQLKDHRLSNLKLELEALAQPQPVPVAVVQQAPVPVAVDPVQPAAPIVEDNDDFTAEPPALETGAPVPAPAPAPVPVPAPAPEEVALPVSPVHVAAAAPVDGAKEEDDKARRARIQPLLKVLKLIHQHKDAAFFRVPVTVEEAPNYYKVIKKPMDLTTIKLLLDNGEINTADELWENLLLIFNNAFTFNSKNSAVYYKAQKLKEFAQKEMESVLEVEKMIVANPNAGSTRRGKRAPEPPKPAASAAAAGELGSTPSRKRDPAVKMEEDLPEDAAATKGRKRARKTESEDEGGEGEEEEEAADAPPRARRRGAAAPRAASTRATRGAKSEDKEEAGATGRGRGRAARGRKK
eukprot:TRINITY_DN17002_c0_g1_i1.p1 TRINITY_DN17002_c0_g1~~TRINITY_DN17002_c0_g1_i1.p1  ORF type:complete len:443 (+),score=128.40 TRINITY_DN17002_c0_g1_i1:151-1479(+)